MESDPFSGSNPRYEVVYIPFDPSDLEEVTTDEEFQDAITEILNRDPSEDILILACHFIPEDNERLTIDDGSFEILDALAGDDKEGGIAYGQFTVSAHHTCRDMAICGDQKDCQIPFRLDLKNERIILSVEKLERKDTYEEF